MLNHRKWLFFDVGSTLVDESLVYQDRFQKIAEAANIPYEYVVETALSFYKQNKKGDAEIANLLNVPKPRWNCNAEHLYSDAESCLKQLCKRYNIGIIANQELGTAQRLNSFGILKYIDLVVASAEVGFAKPDKRIFLTAMQKAHCAPEHAIMIGDRIDNDIIPAKELGMTTVWIKQGFGQYWTFTSQSEQPDYTISSLSELCGLLP